MKRLKNKKGITLIALVVTIVVLLILAAVSITALVGENGLITRAKLAAEKTNQSVQNDIAAMEELNQQLENLINGEQSDTTTLITQISFEETEITKKVGDTIQLTAIIEPSNATNKELEWTSDKPDIAKVESNGLVTAIGPGTAVITAKTKDGSNKTATCTITVESNSTEVFAEDIGKKVNYVAKDYTDLTWRIFYYDETYVYLISEKTVDGSNPVTSCVLSNEISGKYTNGSDEIDSNLRFLNQQWYTQLNGSKSTTYNAKAVAYLMDQSVWAGYKDSEEKAAYAIGAPTLELFMNSYNKSEETTNTIEITCTSTGYNHNIVGNWLLETYNNGIYNKKLLVFSLC